MQYTVNRGDKGKVDVKVDVPQAAFDEAHAQVLGEFGKTANIAGFRPGKAPADLVEGHVGSNKVLNEAASSLISKHLSDILKKEELVPLDAPKIAIDSLTRGAPFSFTASFTLKPQVKLGDWKKLKVAKVNAKEITEKDVDESIKNIYEAWRKQQESKSTLRSNSGQAVKVDSGEQAPEDSGKFIYDAQGNKIPLKDEPKPAASNQAPDDAFAMGIGAKNLAHLRELVKKDLETLVVDQVEAKFEQELFENIKDQGEVDVPEILVEDELNRMLVRLNTTLEREGKALEQYLTEQKTTLDEVKGKWREQAETNVRISLILDEIGKSEKVTVAKEEVDQALKGVNEANLSADQKADLERYIVFSIFQAKTLDLVKKTVGA